MKKKYDDDEDLSNFHDYFYQELKTTFTIIN